MSKNYISSQSLLEDSFRLASKVFKDGFRPDFIIGIWRGGAPIGIAVQEFFEYKNTPTDHIAVRTSSYYGINKQSKEIKVHGLHYLIENANAGDSLLIVDDVFDSGRSVEALIKQIEVLMRLNTPKEIRIATPWYKPANNKTDIVPDYFVNESDEWLVFPHELAGLSKEEIIEGKSELSNILDVIFD
ncbi:phosphoribosyltransferase [Brumicola nitratireducens]|uniref:Putative hypoxanthine phosphoribosyltransferase n=1 Tax=Glaciecola nitratireducens (strain JCM 12485 / KCTC 12276 / FR1064) TaxID=1085623 RepID=G4QLD0_GLANF|nr:phosphoribosyltransferase family protein [Glaciecola nitratireducens]AEP29797.1 putative hypoxanthine phosphoribosyltransferase [Glaciecola nitratireducens FR1064]